MSLYAENLRNVANMLERWDPSTPDGAILVWAWEDVPEALKSVIVDQDDVDWVAFVPQRYEDRDIPWMDFPNFGTETPVPGGTLWFSYSD